MASRGTAAAGKGPSAGPRTAAAPHPDAVAATAGVEREPGVRALQRQPCQGRPPPALAAADPNDDSHSGSSGRGSDYRHLRQGEGDDESDVEQSRQQQEQEDKGEEDDHHHQQQQQLQQRRWLRKRKPDDYMEEEEDQEVEEGEAEYQQQLQRERAQWLHQHKQQARVRKRRAVEFEAAPAVPMHPLGQQDTRPPQPPMGRASAGRAAAAAALMQAPAVARTAVGSAAGLAPRPVPPPAAAAAGGGGGLTHLPDSDNWLVQTASVQMLMVELNVSVQPGGGWVGEGAELQQSWLVGAPPHPVWCILFISSTLLSGTHLPLGYTHAHSAHCMAASKHHATAQLTPCPCAADLTTLLCTWLLLLHRWTLWTASRSGKPMGWAV
jgi:hypothetical protein